MHFWTIWTQWYNFVKKTERLPALQDVVIGVKPPIHQVTTKILSCTPQSFYRMSKKEHIATSNSRQKSSVNLDVTQHIWRKRPATKILNILLATREKKPRVHRTPSLLATKQDCAPGTHSITSHWRIVHQSIHHPTSYRAFTKQHLAKMVTAFEKEGSPMLGPSG